MMKHRNWSMILEGGNVFKDKKTGEEFTQRINQEDVLPTVKWLEAQTGLNLVDNMLGTTGKKSSSGDLDLGVDESQISKDELVSKLLTIKDVGKDDVKKSGSNVHLKTPIAGDPSKGFVQTDFMFGNPEWMKFSMQGGGHNSPYRGTHKHILLASIAKATKSGEHPEGMKWSYLNGLVDRATNEIVSKDPNEIAEILLGSGYTGSDLSNVETIVNGIKDRPEFDELVAEANETFAKDKSHPVPPVTRSVGMLQEGLEARIQHPEDMIYWEGSRGAQKAVNALLGLAENAPTTTTVKWDGSPAIVFGVDRNGKFILTDKGGFTVKSYKGRSETPEELEQMFLSRQNKPGKTLTPEYASFASGMRAIFEPFRQALQNVEPGTYFKGDLLYMKQPQVVDGSYQFKPNVVTYRVPVDSELGGEIGQSDVGVVIHGLIKEDEAGTLQDESLESASQYFKGDMSTGGLLTGRVFIFAPVFVNQAPKFEMDMVKVAERVQARVESSASSIDQLLDEAMLTAKKIKDLPDVLYSYTNSKADNFASVSLDDFEGWVTTNQKLTKQKIANLLQYISEHRDGFAALFDIVKAIEGLKNKLVSQLDKQNTSIKAFIGNVPGGEGYVTKGDDSLLKLVNRGGFTAANRALIREQTEGLKRIGFYPGAFKPFHRGHYESILAAKENLDKLFVIASAGDRIREGEFPLSGEASQIYLDRYIKPALLSQGIELIVSVKSPVKVAIDTAKADYDNDPEAEVSFFAGVEDIGRINPATLQRNLPNLFAAGRVHAKQTETIMGSETIRVSGTGARRALEAADLNAFKESLPDIPEVQRDAAKIMELFIKDSPNVLVRAQEKEAAKKKVKVKMKTEELLAEMISLLIQEEILLEKKKRKGRVHFPPEVEKIIKTKLKKQYKGNPEAMYATATKIMKKMGLKKISKE